MRNVHHLYRQFGPHQWPEMFSFLGKHLAFGLAMGLLFVAMIVATDTAGLASLIFQSDSPALALFIFAAFNALTFASLAMGIAIMTMPHEKGPPGNDDYEPPGWH